MTFSVPAAGRRDRLQGTAGEPIRNVGRGFGGRCRLVAPRSAARAAVRSPDHAAAWPGLFTRSIRTDAPSAGLSKARARELVRHRPERAVTSTPGWCKAKRLSRSSGERVRHGPGRRPVIGVLAARAGGCPTPSSTGSDILLYIRPDDVLLVIEVLGNVVK